MSKPYDEPVEIGITAYFETEAEPYRKPSRGRLLATALAAVTMISVAAGMIVAPGAAVAGTGANAAMDYWESLPTDLPDEEPVPGYTVLLDANGDQFAQFYAQNRIPVEHEEISELFLQALVATEDASFYEHAGVDPSGIVRAAAKNLITDRREGASTLTQQLVENLRVIHAGGPEALAEARAGSLQGKIQEARYAIALESRYTKDELITMYANTVYFGAGAYGVQAAAQRYFGVDASDLTLGQSAILVGLVKNPNGYNPIEFPEIAQDRRDTVLWRMLQEGYIDEARFDKATARKLKVHPTETDNGCTDSDYPLYCDYVRQVLASDPVFGDTQEARDYNLYVGGLTVRTALEPARMEAARKAVEDALGTDNSVAGAVAVVEPGTGHVSAVAQNRDYGDRDGQTQVLYAGSRFQTGSTFKAITLATALEQGWSPSTRMSSPATYTPHGLDHPDGGFSNSPVRSYGPSDAYRATRHSMNTWYIKLVEQTGVREVAAMAERLGLHGVPQNLTGREASITLGSYGASPIELAGAYATFAAGGIHCEPTPVVDIEDTATGERLDGPRTDCDRVLTPGVAAAVNDVLQAPLSEGGTAEDIDLGRQVAGKTGTTNNFAAAWFAGYTPQLSSAVWVGDPRGGTAHPLRDVRAYDTYFAYVDGSRVPAPIWKDTMAPMVDGMKERRFASPSAAVSTLRSTTDLPDVTGMRAEVAAGELNAAGYVARIADETSPASPGQAPGVVTKQRVGEEGTVRLTLSEGSAPHLLGRQLAPGQTQEGEQQ